MLTIGTIIIIASVAIYLILLANRDYLGIEYSYRKISTIDGTSYQRKKTFSDKNFFLKLGQFFATALPPDGLAYFEREIAFLNRDLKVFYVGLGQTMFATLSIIVLYLFSHNFSTLMIGIFIFVGFFAEVPMSVSKCKASIDKAVPHVVAALKVLVVNTETPLGNSLEIIAKGLPQYYEPMRNELLRLLAKAEKSNMRETLMDWQSESGKFKDFLSLLISINEGASKMALKTFIDNFLEKTSADVQEEIKSKSENLQLILLGPILLIFIVILQPLVTAINFMMNQSGVQF